MPIGRIRRDSRVIFWRSIDSGVGSPEALLGDSLADRYVLVIGRWGEWIVLAGEGLLPV